jgi:hypothetical protein
VLGKVSDRRVAVVLDQDHDELQALRRDRCQLGGHHQVGAVPDHHHHVAVVAQRLQPTLDAHASSDLVAHAAERVLDVVAQRVAHAP